MMKMSVVINTFEDGQLPPREMTGSWLFSTSRLNASIGQDRDAFPFLNDDELLVEV